ncbi:MAG: c-type cytochrome [Opitutaceae bacterium]
MNHPLHRFLGCFLLLELLSSSVFAAAPLVPKPLTPMTNVPLVQMLVPGFSVRELPVKLKNINNLVYAPDGRLFALGYDGFVYQLKDTDGDGLEDTATNFHDNTRGEIPPSIGMAWGANGLYIASRGKVIHLKDKGDGTSELAIVASGWRPSVVAAGSNLDAIGVAVDPAGNVYFGLGVDAYNGAYRVNKQTGHPDYNQFNERGSMVKLSPDWKRREIIATGVRFTVSLAFNAEGDLFASDQEGATWLPNGNPFDELLHIQLGRHYGFPPRHPLYLPGVIDEPSVYDYAPQHQSACGLHFNETSGGGSAIFGPNWWRGDAFVAGESRGKIWRTKLVKTAAGYVAQNDLVACLSMLTIDAVPTPQGDMIVACHSGPPDWGTGPRGQGKLFKISYTDKSAPQPVLAYAASPTETRVIFDRPVDPAQWRNLAQQSAVVAGKYVTAGDRFESLSFSLPYQAAKDQLKAPRVELPVLSAGIAPDLQSIVLRTSPRTEASHYAVTLPEGLAPTRPQNTEKFEVLQHAAIDLATDVSGLEAEWRDANGKIAWSGWLPHLDLKVSREFTSASEEHRKLFALLKTPGTLALRGQLDLHLMLRTALQPGTKLDFTYPSELVTLSLKSSGKLELKSSSPAAKLDRGGEGEISLTTESKENGWLPFDLKITTGTGEASLDVSWHTGEDARPRALQSRRVLMPWATPSTGAPAGSEERVIPEIAGGDWRRGQEVFKGAAACFACHQVRGEGGIIGPDLSNLTHRDYASVLKDIVQPSAAINPDRIAYLVEMKDGTSVTGMLLEDTAQNVMLAEVGGNKRTLAKNNITGMKASAVSLMPEGLWQNLSSQQQRDLMTYLLTEPPAGSAK